MQALFGGRTKETAISQVNTVMSCKTAHGIKMAYQKILYVCVQQNSLRFWLKTIRSVSCHYIVVDLSERYGRNSHRVQLFTKEQRL